MVIAKVRVWRSVLPQIIASSSKNCILLVCGSVVSLPTVIVPALTQSSDELQLTFHQASWFGSMASFFVIIGTLISGGTSHILGRKRAMLAATIPHMIGYLTLYLAKSVVMVFVAISLMGLGIGLSESSVSTYVAEISQPSIRGTLLAIGSIMVQLGGLIIFTLGSFFDWRTAVLFAMVLPYIAFAIVLIIPEAPSWLLSKNRKKDAQRSLQWLRGWVPPQNVEKELDELEQHVENSKKCKTCEKQSIVCSHPPLEFGERLLEMFRRRNLSVFFIVLVLFLIDYGMGSASMRPFMIQILRAYGSPIDPHLATVAIGVASVVAKLTSVGTIKLLGKRRIGLISLSSSFVCLVGLAVYAQIRLPPNSTSFVAAQDVHVEISSVPLVLYVSFYFCCHFGIQALPWLILCEMFPFKNRCLCTSVAIAVGQIINFATTKCYIYLEMGFALSGTMWFFSSVSFVGIFLVYFLLPESEGVSMQDIEVFFSDNSRKLTDIHIAEFVQKKRERAEKENETHQL